MNPDLDLELTRIIQARPATLWRCWTEPELLKQWFCPAPWRVKEATLDPRPGGIFHCVMQGPDGTVMDEGAGCFLAVEPERSLSFTDAMGPGHRPRGKGFMTAFISFEPVEAGTRYHALAKHASPEDRKSHEEMGFFEGWGTAAEQLEELAKSLEN